MTRRRLLLLVGVTGALLGVAPAASALPVHGTSAGRVACVTVQGVDGLCVGNPLPQ